VPVMTPVARLLRVVFVLAVAACSTARPESAGRTWPAWLQECSLPPAGELARCGTVRVPESDDARAGRHIDLRVVVVPAYAETPEPTPVVPLAGGPGQGAADLAAALAQRFDVVRNAHDLVFVDQRGTGESNGLYCPPPVSARDLMGTIFDPARLAACRGELAERADLTRYTTAIAASDYEPVFDRLGYREVNIVGISYGSRMGLEIARRFPRRVRTLTLEGVVPPGSFDWPASGATDADAALNAVVSDCVADETCARAFPRLTEDIDTAFARLARAPVLVAITDPATGARDRVPFGPSDLGYATRGLLYGNDAWSLPMWFRSAADGNYDRFAQAYVTRARALDRQLARGVHLGVYCAEDLPFVDAARVKAASAGTRLGDYLLEQYSRACQIWPRAAISPSFRDPVVSTVPTLLMSGRRDPVTPPRTAEQAARTLSRSRVVVWRYGGHGTDGLASGDCRAAILREFLASADVDRLSLECVTRDAVLPFRLGFGPN
jgi:pimeloyl-ACP methyl ester carboxylesterase